MENSNPFDHGLPSAAEPQPNEIPCSHATGAKDAEEAKPIEPWRPLRPWREAFALRFPRNARRKTTSSGIVDKWHGGRSPLSGFYSCDPWSTGLNGACSKICFCGAVA